MESSNLTAEDRPLSDFTQLSNTQAEEQAKIWLVLNSPTRLRIIDLLNRYDGLLCVSEIAKVLDESISLISSHLAILKGAGMVTAEKYKNYVYY